jgi:hypothetical protein
MRKVLACVSVACTLGAILGCDGAYSLEGSYSTALSGPSSSSAPELISIEFEDPAVVAAEVDIVVHATAPDGAIDGLHVAVQAAEAPPAELHLAEVSDAGGLFTGSFVAPGEEGDYLLTVVATSADGEQVEETVAAFAAADGVRCTATCYDKKGRVVATKSKTTSSNEFCEIFCNRFCFGPQGNGAASLLCEY